MTFGLRFIAWMVALLTIIAATCLSPAELCAQSYDEQTIVEVNEHFKKGAQFYYDENYDAAIAEFEAAHAKIPNAIFLYNISLAQAKKGETEKSLATAEAAQKMGGLGPDEQVQNEARITALRRVAITQGVAEHVARFPPVEPMFHFGTLSWVGSGLIVAGVLGLGGVVLIDRSISGDVDAYKAAVARGDTGTADSLRDDIRPHQTSGKVLFVVSSLAIASGAGLLVYDLWLKPDQTSVSFAPIRGGFGVSLTQHF